MGWAVGLVRGSTANLLTKLALEFLVLTTVRSGVVGNANWGEILWQRRTWEIPFYKMKGWRNHKVPPPPGSRPHLRQRHLLRAAHRLPVEGVGRTGICSGSTARLRFQEWVAAGVSEAAGVPVALAVDGANRHDMKLVRFTVDSMAVDRPAPSPEHPQGLCLDKGYDFAEARLGGIRLHRPHTQSGRGGSGHQERGRIQGASLGGGTQSRMAEPFSAHPGALGQVPGELHRLSSFCLCPHYPPRRRVIRIGS